jgi:hypothetical protein
MDFMSAMEALEAGGFVIVNGDLVDRGRDQALVLLQMMVLKVLYPDNFFINRGNHEVRMRAVVLSVRGMRCVGCCVELKSEAC